MSRPSDRLPPKDALHQAAASLDAAPELLPLLPELLAGIDALGTEPERVVELLAPLRLGARPRALDLGCGKGAHAVALATTLEMQVVGVDAIAEFVAEAERRARDRRVAHLCRFRCADLRLPPTPEDAAPFDVVLLLAVGRPFGGLAATVGRLRERVRQGGFLVIDDAVLADGAGGAASGPGGYRPLATSRLELLSCGDRLVREIAFTPAQVAAVEAPLQARIAANAARLARQHPEHAALIRGYLDAQRRECEALVERLRPMLWLLERA